MSNLEDILKSDSFHEPPEFSARRSYALYSSWTSGRIYVYMYARVVILWKLTLLCLFNVKVTQKKKLIQKKDRER